MNRRILFLNPPQKSPVQSNLPASVEKLRGFNPPINLLYAAGIARAEQGWDVRFTDADADSASDVDLARSVADWSPDIVGITSTTITYRDALSTARVVKAAHPETAVVMGGVQPFLYPGEALAQAEIDAVLSGEAEESLPPLLRAFDGGGLEGLRVAKVPGVAVKGDDLKGFRPAPEVGDLDRFPMPAWELAPLHRYTSLIARHAPVSIMVTSRGCPFRCKYCASSPTGKAWRAHGPERVAEELRRSWELGVRYMMFYDESFAINKKRVHAICEALRAAKNPLPWMARITPGTADQEMINSMRAAGCDMLTMGVESGDAQVLKTLGRATPLEAVRSSFAMARKAGMRTIAYFMIGSPGETAEQVRASMDLAVELNPEAVHASIYTIYPATRFYENDVSSIEGFDDFWRRFALHPADDFVPPIGSDVMAEDELQQLLAEFYRRFAMRPSYLLSRLLAVRSWREFKRGFTALRVILKGFSATPIDRRIPRPSQA